MKERWVFRQELVDWITAEFGSRPYFAEKRKDRLRFDVWNPVCRADLYLIPEEYRLEVRLFLLGWTEIGERIRAAVLLAHYNAALWDGGGFCMDFQSGEICFTVHHRLESGELTLQWLQRAIRKSLALFESHENMIERLESKEPLPAVLPDPRSPSLREKCKGALYEETVALLQRATQGREDMMPLWRDNFTRIKSSEMRRNCCKLMLMGVSPTNHTVFFDGPVAEFELHRQAEAATLAIALGQQGRYLSEDYRGRQGFFAVCRDRKEPKIRVQYRMYELLGEPERSAGFYDALMDIAISELLEALPFWRRLQEQPDALRPLLQELGCMDKN